MSVVGFLEVIAPVYARETDSEQMANLLAMAEMYRPLCLDEDKQDLAVAYYVAYLIASSAEREVNPLGITSEREGDISRSYAKDQTAAAQFYAKWQEFNALCGRLGAITVGLNVG